MCKLRPAQVTAASGTAALHVACGAQVLRQTRPHCQGWGASRRQVGRGLDTVAHSEANGTRPEMLLGPRRLATAELEGLRSVPWVSSPCTLRGAESLRRGPLGAAWCLAALRIEGGIFVSSSAYIF